MSRTFTDRYGTELGIGGEASFAGCARVTVSKPCGVHVEAADFPALIAALHEAAGLPAPVILERPEISPGEAKGVNVFTVDLNRDLSVRVGLGSAKGVPLGPSVARHLASVIAAYADAAEAAREPDPAEVEELTAEISEALKGPVIDSSFDLNTSRVAARAALRWLAGKQQRGGDRDA